MIEGWGIPRSHLRAAYEASMRPRSAVAVSLLRPAGCCMLTTPRACKAWMEDTGREATEGGGYKT